MKLAPILTRLVILSALAGGGYYFYSNQQSLTESLPGKIAELKQSIQGASITVDKDALLTQANQKLNQKQPIIDNSPEEEVLGDNTSIPVEIPEPVKKVVDDTTQKISQEINNLPKDQAAAVTRQVCEQIIDSLEQ